MKLKKQGKTHYKRFFGKATPRKAAAVLLT